MTNTKQLYCCSEWAESRRQMGRYELYKRCQTIQFRSGTLKKQVQMYTLLTMM